MRGDAQTKLGVLRTDNDGLKISAQGLTTNQIKLGVQTKLDYTIAGGTGDSVLTEESGVIKKRTINDGVWDTDAVLPTSYSQKLTTNDTSYVINHGLGTKNVLVVVYDTTNHQYGFVGYEPYDSTPALSDNHVTIYFTTAPAANQMIVSVFAADPTVT